MGTTTTTNATAEGRRSGWMPDRNSRTAGSAKGRLDGRSHVDLDSRLGLDKTQPASRSLVKFQNNGAVLSPSGQGAGIPGIDLLITDGSPRCISCAWPNDAIHVRTRKDTAGKSMGESLVTYDGSARSGVHPTRTENPRSGDAQDQLTNSRSGGLCRCGSGSRNGEANFTGMIDEVRWVDREITAEDVRSQVLADFPDDRRPVAGTAERRGTGGSRPILSGRTMRWTISLRGGADQGAPGRTS